MSNAFHGTNGTSALHVGVRVAAVVAVVGMITLAAGRGTVLLDELAVEQHPTATVQAPAMSRLAVSDTSFALAPLSRDPSLPSEADVMPRASDEPAAPTF